MSKRAIKILLAVFILVSAVFVYGCITTQKQAATGGAILIPRTLEGAPPFIPHEVEDEQTCLDCHRLGENDAVITPHPDRVNCVQCHITQDMSIKPFVENTF
ncbi:MAG: hypothetical protein GXP46_04320 [Deferribacteres bacterium]|nr:hypothetical protein [Deferribacteres bacterium]